MTDTKHAPEPVTQADKFYARGRDIYQTMSDERDLHLGTMHDIPVAVTFANAMNATRTTPAPSQHSELVDRLEFLAVALSDGGWEKSMHLVYEAIAALRQAPCTRIEALERAREALRAIKVEAEREQGHWQHLKRVIAVQSAAALANKDRDK